MPKTKGKNLPPVRVTDEFYIETEKCARQITKDGVYLSEYIRLAVEEKNERTIQATSIISEKPRIEVENTQTVEKSPEKKPTIPELKQKVKDMERPTFFKK